MGTYRCNVYYEYVYSVEVDAETQEEAFDKAYEMAESVNSADLDYVGYAGGSVYTVVNGKIDLGSLKQMA